MSVVNGCGQMDLIRKAIETAERVFAKNSYFFGDFMTYRCDSLLVRIIDQENIFLDSYPFKSENLCGMLIVDEYEKTIVYNSTLIAERRNFTIAHELGHYFLHRDKQSKFTDRSKDIDDNTLNELEMQANVFAAQLILPNSIVLHLLQNGLHYFQIKKKVQISYQALYWRLVNYLINNHGLNKSIAQQVVEEFRYFSEASMNNIAHHKMASIYSIVTRTERQKFFV